MFNILSYSLKKRKYNYKLAAEVEKRKKKEDISFLFVINNAKHRFSRQNDNNGYNENFNIV